MHIVYCDLTFWSFMFWFIILYMMLDGAIIVWISSRIFNWLLLKEKMIGVLNKMM